MDGTVELAQLAQMLRIGAKAGRRIADVRPADAETIQRLASQAETMAAELDAILDMPGGLGRPVGPIQ